jgi:NADH-quinone oxidoreductase subunit N
MNISLISLEMLVLALGLVVLMADLLLAPRHRPLLGWAAAGGLAVVLAWSFVWDYGNAVQYAFSGMYVMDPLAMFFKRFFLVAGIIVLLISTEYSDRIVSGPGEYYAITLFALLGMMFAASANDFASLFVSLELITVSFYVLVSYQRSRVLSLEAGVKYLIIGAMSTGFTVFGIALVFGTSGVLAFGELAEISVSLMDNRLFLAGMLLILVGLGFKISFVPVQIWAPDVYQGAPVPTAAFLAVGSKAAGFALLLRLLFTAVPAVAIDWKDVLIWISAITILYGNLAAIPQRNVKRLLGYSSIAQAGYLMMGVAALSDEGLSAVLYYMGGYLFTVLAAFAVLCIVLRNVDSDDIAGLAGLNQRAPLLAAGIAFSMVSLAGIPPLAGFFGKFLLIKSIIAEAPAHSGYYWLAFVAIAGVIISIYYYFGVIRAVYWSKETRDLSPVRVSLPMKATILVCIAGMLFIGIFPAPLLRAASQAVQIVAGVPIVP